MQDDQSESEIRNIGAQSVANTGVLADCGDCIVKQTQLEERQVR